MPDPAVEPAAPRRVDLPGVLFAALSLAVALGVRPPAKLRDALLRLASRL